MSCPISCPWLSKIEHLFCSELPCLPATLSFTLSSFLVCVRWNQGIIGTDPSRLLFLSMLYIGYTFKCWPQYYDERLDVSKHSKHVYLPNMGLKHLFSPTQSVASIAVPYFSFVIAFLLSNLTAQGWTHDDEHPWTDHGWFRTYNAFANSAICYPDQCGLGGRGKNGLWGIDSSHTCLRAVLTKHCHSLSLTFYNKIIGEENVWKYIQSKTSNDVITMGR